MNENDDVTDDSSRQAGNSRAAEVDSGELGIGGNPEAQPGTPLSTIEQDRERTARLADTRPTDPGASS